MARKQDKIHGNTILKNIKQNKCNFKPESTTGKHSKRQESETYSSAYYVKALQKSIISKEKGKIHTAMATPTHSDRKPKESFQPPLVRCPFACF
jgi:hypothetical protein